MSFESDQCAPENLLRSNKLLRYLYVTCYAVSDYGSIPHCLVTVQGLYFIGIFMYM
ncbi:hypothetical protein ACRRTK_021533 [Alexandromys fortis]